MFGFRSLPKLTIEKPCSADWSGMQAAPDGTRFCRMCQKQVHDFSKMTAREIRSLIRHSPNGFCGNITYNRHGDMVVRPEPIVRVSRSLVQLSVMGAASLSAIHLAAAENGPPATFVQSSTVAGSECGIKVSVRDANGAPVPGAAVALTRSGEAGQAQVGQSNEAGEFQALLPQGSYSVRVQAVGFVSYERSGLDLSRDQTTPVSVPVELQVGSTGGVAVCPRPHPAKSAFGKLSRILGRL